MKLENQKERHYEGPIMCPPKLARTITAEQLRGILQDMLNDARFMHGTRDDREERIVRVATAHGITLHT